MRLKGKKPIFNVKDTWSLDSALNPIIAEGLKKFKDVIMSDNVAGYPQQVIDESPNPLSIHAVPGFIKDGEHGAKLNPDYDKMDDSGNFPCEFEITDQEKYDNHKANDAEHHRKVQEGLELFSKYYKSLWW